MSERKKTCGNCAGRIESLIYKDRCDITEEVIEDMSTTCDDWEPNNEVLREMQDDGLKALRKERDTYKADVDILEDKIVKAEQERDAARDQFLKSLERESEIEKELDAARKMLRLAAYFANDKCPDEFQSACPLKHSSCEDCWIDSWQREVKIGNGRCKECENQGIAKTQ